MPVAALAADQAAPHPQPHAAAVVRPRDGGRTVKVPLRLVVGAQYPDAALSVYVKIAALALRPEGCTARVDTLAAYLGMSKSAVERGLRPLTQPDPVDGLVEVPTHRRTYRDGRGQSAERSIRPLTRGELWVRIPVRAAEALTPRLLRLYALLAYATARRIPVTAAELGEMLYHHTGQKAGQSLGERQARRLVDELAATGWLTVHRREGQRGRHAYETNDRPLHPVPALDAAVPAAASVLEDQAPGQLPLWGDESPVIHDGSGADDLDGSLASKEDHWTDRPEKTELSGGIRRRRGDRKSVAGPVDNPVPDTFGRGGLVLRTDDEAAGAGPATGRPAYTGPALQLSPRIWRVLEPVRHELPALSAFVLRKVAREIGAQLNAPGGSEERLIDRLTRRYATTTAIRDVGRWLLGAALVRHGCGRPDCETGVIWETGADCDTCAVNRQTAAARARRDAELAERSRLLDEQREQRLAEAEALEEQQRQAAGRARARLLEELGDEPLPGAAVFGLRRPEPELPPARALPPKKTYRQRDQASDEEVLAAIAEHGPAIALHIYGHLRALPLLNSRPNPVETGSDRRTHAQ
ncbi:hypothetical protein ACF09J_07885 [Streptomyces sp. NPDC014889]|uniref:hypothetical protein n=1 Tax=Streptomyces sp. NPDC014889 TaxID=3364928 RepID=UPI0036FC3374